jgi:hypothetical protein
MSAYDSSQHSPGRDEDWYQVALESLCHDVLIVEKKVKKKRDTLLLKYPAEALHDLSNSFVRIAQDFITFSRKRKSKHYRIINRSKSRIKFCNNIIKEAKNVAMVFEKYAKKPEQYSRVDCQLSIEELLVELENLRLSKG